MQRRLHSFSELASSVGRFEMETIPNRGIRREHSAMDVGRAETLGLFAASRIFACYPEDDRASVINLLSKLGDRSKKHWELRAPRSERERKLWERLLAEDHVLIFEAPMSSDWQEHVIRQMYLPDVAAVPSSCLSQEWENFEKASFKSAENLLHLSLGVWRTVCTFVGNGDLFNSAVRIASERPPMMWGYTVPAFRDICRSRRFIFGRKPKAQETDL